MAVFPALFGLLMAAFVTGQHVEISPLQAVRRIGDDLTILCKVNYPIDSCRMTVGVTSHRLRPNDQEGEWVYSGKGLQFGECGAHIRHVKEEWNGNISCYLPPETGSIEPSATMRLLVARAPADPELVTRNNNQYHEGDLLNAQCVVRNGRPAARITWFLDNEPLLTGLHQPIVTSEPGSDLQTISQNVSRTLAADDGEKTLLCKAEHEALDQPREAKLQLSVQYPPKRLESGGITIFGLKIGSEGRLNVTYRSNPPSNVEWVVGDQRLPPGATSNDGSAVVLEPTHLGVGYYNATLILHQVAKEDVDRVYYLVVSNPLGREEFAVRLSTMDEPAGVELDTGAIVGIVVAVLALLIAIFLVVFAKATGRWCFAGKGGTRDKQNSGESDTESATGKDRSRLASLRARVRAALPRGKDKVQATEQAESEDKALSEEKKGVVYAELALVEHSNVPDKPAPPSTEYAEIVYTENKDAKE